MVEVASATYAALLCMLAGMALLRPSELCGQGDPPVAEGAGEGYRKGGPPAVAQEPRRGGTQQSSSKAGYETNLFARQKQQCRQTLVYLGTRFWTDRVGRVST